MARAGVDTAEAAVELAGRIAELGALRLLGVGGYERHCSLTPECELRRERQQQMMGFLVETAEALRAAGLTAQIVSAGGKATSDWTAAPPGVTETQAGSYVSQHPASGTSLADGAKANVVVSPKPRKHKKRKH